MPGNITTLLPYVETSFVNKKPVVPWFAGRQDDIANIYGIEKASAIANHQQRQISDINPVAKSAG